MSGFTSRAKKREAVFWPPYLRFSPVETLRGPHLEATIRPLFFCRRVYRPSPRGLAQSSKNLKERPQIHFLAHRLANLKAVHPQHHALSKFAGLFGGIMERRPCVSKDSRPTRTRINQRTLKTKKTRISIAHHESVSTAHPENQISLQRQSPDANPHQPAHHETQRSLERQSPNATPCQPARPKNQRNLQGQSPNANPYQSAHPENKEASKDNRPTRIRMNQHT